MHISEGISVEQLADDLGRLFRYLQGGATGSPLDAVAELELSFSQARTLLALDRLGGSASVGKLAERLPLSQGATSRVVESLQRIGLVERQEDASDRRVKRVRITVAGRETVGRFEEFREAKMAVLRELLSLLEPTDRLAFAKLLERIMALEPLLSLERSLSEESPAGTGAGQSPAGVGAEPAESP